MGKKGREKRREREGGNNYPPFLLLVLQTRITGPVTTALGRNYPPFSGSILLRLLRTSIVGIAFVPTASRSLSSRSFSLSELNASTLSACLPAVTTLRSILCTLSARWSILNSTLDWTACSRDLVVDLRFPNDDDGSVRESSIFASSASRSDDSGNGAFFGSPSWG